MEQLIVDGGRVLDDLADLQFTRMQAAAVLSPVQRRLEKNIRLAKEKEQEEAEEAKQRQGESSEEEEEKGKGKYALEGKRKKRTPSEVKAALHGHHDQTKKRKGLHGVS